MSNFNQPKPSNESSRPELEQNQVISDKAYGMIIKSLKGVIARRDEARKKGEALPLPNEYYEAVERQIEKVNM